MTTNTNRNICIIALLSTVLFMAICGPLFADEPAKKGKAKPKPLVTISKETTVITEPLRPDGYPDYVAALNQRFSKGVTPENNFAVLFWKAVGPSEIMPEIRQQYFQMLGIESLPEKGDYFVDVEKFQSAEIKRLMKQPKSGTGVSEDEMQAGLWDQFTSARKQPWSREELPWLADWIDTNEKQLDMLVEASKRPRRYDPLIGESAMIFVLPGPQQSRAVVRALTARAMLRIGEAKAEEAWQDLLACHRIARLIGQGPTLVELLVAINNDHIAQAGDRALLEHCILASDKIAAMQVDIIRLLPLPKTVDKINTGERYAFLDCVSSIARNGREEFTKYTVASGIANADYVPFTVLLEDGKEKIDWDIAFRIGNSWFDKTVACIKIPTRIQREAAFYEKYLKNRKIADKSEKELQKPISSILNGSDKDISELVGNCLVVIFFPACQAALHAEDRFAINGDLTDIAFALAAYRADHKSYPDKLEGLVPKYTEAIPNDIFNNNAPLHYVKHENGFLLYSVGSNGRDDGGKGEDDCNSPDCKGWDDISVRVPSSERGEEREERGE